VPSSSLGRWRSTDLTKLDEVEDAHAAVGGTGVGRRTATQQINDAYLLLLSARFQRFCRDLHTEAATAIAVKAGPAIGPLVASALTSGRNLDRGNPMPDKVQDDFKRLGLDLWLAMGAIDKRNSGRRNRLEQLMHWRNALAHQQFPMGPVNAKKVTGTDRTLRWARRWRSVCDVLAGDMDTVVRAHVHGLLGTPPW
jgi:hypothetical protein